MFKIDILKNLNVYELMTLSLDYIKDIHITKHFLTLLDSSLAQSSQAITDVLSLTIG